MKFVILTVLLFVAAVYAAPTKISDNNVGDIVNVGIKANLELDNSISALLASLTGKYDNDQQIKINLPGQDAQPYGSGMISPEMIQQFIALMSNKGE
ncbi:hypothetical protein PVAND_013066 [Polypedilum vanderplanki]|uniref:Uncharacterized protein n=1 Tax=Polypedilum vanderplanki TaxID=319348 RepID=A0A9J6CNC8_POLVA|nr:hypothetical protein PVAND_013066 [Polypedilum vanderplanki]